MGKKKENKCWVGTNPLYEWHRFTFWWMVVPQLIHLYIYFIVLRYLSDLKYKKWWEEMQIPQLISEYQTKIMSNHQSQKQPLVVICFHFSIFVVLETAMFYLLNRQIMLWFAFILVSLSYWKQRIQWSGSQCGSCDLLSF